VLEAQSSGDAPAQMEQCRNMAVSVDSVVAVEAEAEKRRARFGPLANAPQAARCGVID